jgi:hypothetical protein
MNICYRGQKIYQDLSYEECLDVLQELSEQYYNSGDYDPYEIELEEE